jgi:hypothetical protein
MKTQWEILLFIFVLNLAVGLVIALNVAGTQYATPSGTGSINSTEYESHFNATETAKNWGTTPFSGIPVIGDIFGGFSFLWQAMGYLIDGFPTLLTWISESFIVDANGQLAFAIVANVIRGVEALLVSLFVIEFISGRVFTD